MVARLRPNNTPTPKQDNAEVLLVTLTAATGAVLDQATAADPTDAVRCAIRIVSRRSFLHAGDALRVTKPANGDIHQPRETD
jgi:hypothetical protein